MQQKAAELFAGLIEDHPRVDEYQFRLAVCLNQQGDFLDDVEMLKDAHKLLTRVVSLNPDNHEYRYELAYSYGRMAEIQRSEGQSEEARDLSNISIAILSELHEQEPGIERYKFMLAKQNVELAQLLADKENFTDAAKRFDDSIAVLNELLLREMGNDNYLKELGQTLGHSGFAHEKLGEMTKAKGLYERAQEVWTQFLEIRPDDEVAQEALEWLKGKIQKMG